MSRVQATTDFIKFGTSVNFAIRPPQAGGGMCRPVPSGADTNRSSRPAKAVHF
jgi:hypothetical protein